MFRFQHRQTRLLARIASILFLPAFFFPAFSWCGTNTFHIKERVNAHADEFMAFTGTADGNKLIIGTEKGKILVWDVLRNGITKYYNQGSPVHAVVLINNDRDVVAAGGWHAGDKKSFMARKWNLETGDYENWEGIDEDAALFLATNPEKTLVAASTLKGNIIVWNSDTGKKAASWNIPYPPAGLAVIGSSVYITILDQKLPGKMPESRIQVLNVDEPDSRAVDLIPFNPGKLWMYLVPSPDGNILSAMAIDMQTGKMQNSLLDPSSGAVRQKFEGAFAHWINNEAFVLFDQNQPLQTVSLKPESTQKWSAEGSIHAQGSPDRMMAVNASPDGKTAFGLFQFYAGLVSWTPSSRKGDILTMEPGNIYAMDLMNEHVERSRVMTGGDDGYVRVWKLQDLTLCHEFKVPSGFPQGVALLDTGHKAVYSYSGPQAPTIILLVDLETGRQTQLATINQPYVTVKRAGDDFMYFARNRLLLSGEDGNTVREFPIKGNVKRFEISNNGLWMGAIDVDGNVYVHEIQTGRLTGSTRIDLTQFAVSDNGRFVYFTDYVEGLKRWDLKKNKIKSLSGIRGQASSLRLSRNQEYIIIGGNHKDVAIYKESNGKCIGSYTFEAADFSITNVRLIDKRVILSTDIGVLIDGEADF